MNTLEDKAKEFLKMVEDYVEETNKYIETLKNKQNRAELSTYKPGDIIVGDESGTEYIVLEHFDDGTTLVCSKDFMLRDVQFDSDKPIYEGSALQQKITEKCLPVFEKDFGADNLVEREVDMVTMDGQHPDENIVCKVRPKTFDETRKYTQLLFKEELDDYEWTITRWSTPDRGWDYSVTVVSPRGDVNGLSCRNSNNCLGVRPVCILKSNIFVSKGE